MSSSVLGEEIDVEQQLLSGRRRARNSGVPYPLRYSKSILSFDNWNTMFLKNCFKGLTMHHFPSAPPLVLDLGCGAGYWAIEAVMQWPTSTIVGFDIMNIQPDLYKLDIYPDLPGRLKWVHGNLLDGLPFPSNHFDFIRCVNIALGVPEDEWQSVLEDISRVLKPGGVLEIIEEDLIFPAPNRPSTGLNPPPNPVFFPSPMPSGTLSIRTSATIATGEFWPTSIGGSSDSTHSKRSLTSLFPESPILPIKTHWTNVSSVAIRETEEEEEASHEVHPQDHSRLKAAWDSMLSTRFLNSNVIKVLPFYLSTCFVDVQSHPPLHIPLPPNSSTPSSPSNSYLSDTESLYWYDPDTQFTLVPYSGRKSNDNKNFQKRSGATSTSRCMHLAKTVSTVLACKEAIWDEYKVLYSADLPPVTRTSRPSEAASQAYESSARDGFERAWSNWENDMRDRIGRRHHLGTELSWAEPLGDRPDWRIWKDNLDMNAVRINDDFNGGQPEPMCRSIRGFAAWKPL